MLTANIANVLLAALLFAACRGGGESTVYEVTAQATCTPEERSADLEAHATRVENIAKTRAADAALRLTASAATETSVAIAPPSTALATATLSMGELIVDPFLCP